MSSLAELILSGGSGRPRLGSLRRRPPKRLAVAYLAMTASMLALGVPMFLLRSSLSEATTALVLVVPVVVGVSVGGLGVGVAGVVMGFVVYDLVFIPPYYTLSVGAAQNWVALGVYVLVLLLVARVVSGLDDARAAAEHRTEEARGLLRLSELLIEGKQLNEVLEEVAASLVTGMGYSTVVVLLPREGRLEAVAGAGVPMSDAELAEVLPAVTAEALSARLGSRRADHVRTIPLSTTDGMLGVLVVRGEGDPRSSTDVARTFANHAAVAIRQSQLREDAIRARALEELGEWRRALLAMVSHDLRSPLASVKAALSDLGDPDLVLDPADRDELLHTAESQADALTRLVSSLLDLSRIEAGAFELRSEPVRVGELIKEAEALVGQVSPRAAFVIDPASSALQVMVDRLLTAHVLANLLENAARYAPPGTDVEISAAAVGHRVRISVSDRGPGIPAQMAERIFDPYFTAGGAGRAGLGLSIAKAFVQAHHGHISVDPAYGEGARFVVELPSAHVAARGG
ncbi:MAG: ATP-binding protein [Actinomycetota bacterium]|nr:ATP-binding protein [Actinomycetota bacterium]